MDFVINANNFPVYTIASGCEFEPLFLPPDGTRTRFSIGWNGHGRYTAGSLLIWKNGVSLKPGTDFTEEDNGVFFNFATAPTAEDSYDDYLVGYIPRPADLAFATGAEGSGVEGEEYFLFPNWLEAPSVGTAFWIGKYQAARNTSTSTGEGSGTTPVSKQGVIPWASLTFTNASAYASAKGNGFRLVRNREWVNIALWCDKMGLYPAGNSASGVDGMGVAGTPDSSCSGRCLTGTGPVTWNHNLRAGGIADMVGNIWEMIDGVQYNSNVLWLYDDSNNLVSTGVAPAFGSSGGSFSLLRTDDALKYDAIPASGTGKAVKGNDGFWFANGTMVLYRGGDWSHGALAGLFTFIVDHAASYSVTYLGFRLGKSLI